MKVLLTKQQSEANAVISMSRELEYWKKAFEVMRKLAIQCDRERIISQLGSKDAPFCSHEPEDGIDSDFERRMKNASQTDRIMDQAKCKNCGEINQVGSPVGIEKFLRDHFKRCGKGKTYLSELFEWIKA